MKISLNGRASWLCTVCGHIWPRCNAITPPCTCALCGSRYWNSPPPDDPDGELPAPESNSRTAYLGIKAAAS